MKTKEILFLVSALALGVGIALFQTARDAEQSVLPASAPEPVSAEPIQEVVVRRIEEVAAPALPEPTGGWGDATIADIESMEELGLSSYEEFIDYEDDWDEEPLSDARAEADEVDHEVWDEFPDRSTETAHPRQRTSPQGS